MRDSQANSNDLMLCPLIRCLVFPRLDCSLGRFILSTGLDSRLVLKMQETKKTQISTHTHMYKCGNYTYMYTWYISRLVIRTNLRVLLGEASEGTRWNREEIKHDRMIHLCFLVRDKKRKEFELHAVVTRHTNVSIVRIWTISIHNR